MAVKAGAVASSTASAAVVIAGRTPSASNLNPFRRSASSLTKKDAGITGGFFVITGGRGGKDEIVCIIRYLAGRLQFGKSPQACWTSRGRFAKRRPLAMAVSG